MIADLLPMSTQGSLPAVSKRQKLRLRFYVPSARLVLIFAALVFFVVTLILPLLAVFFAAFSRGIGVYFQALLSPDTRDAMRLSLSVAAVVVPVNTIYGIALAWLVTKCNVAGRGFILSLVDLPFAVSPVVAGLMIMLLFGRQGWWGPWLTSHHIEVAFAFTGIALASIFVTSPLVARQLIPVMTVQGHDAEEAAFVLGANAWQIFWRVTLPSNKRPLAQGVLLCSARTLGEFGAVSVVSGHIRGSTITLPLQIEILFNEYHFAAAYSVASLLALFAVLTLLLLNWPKIKIMIHERQPNPAGAFDVT